MPLTEDLAQRIAATAESRWPAVAEDIVIRGFADCVGVMLAGWSEPVVEIARRHVGVTSSALPFEIGVSGPSAALVYGCAAHALDFDDVGLAAHPSAVLVPTLLASGLDGNVSGRDMIAAYLAGYEAWAELWRRDRDPLHDKGWHPTAVLGTIAAAAAAASLRRATAQTTRTALGIAASFASGLVANFGTMTKPFQVGRAAANGLEAVLLAELGMSASADALEHDLGFLRAFSPKDRAERHAPLPDAQGLRILQSGLNIKLYPVCYAVHRAIDAMLALREAEDWQPDEVVHVDVELGATQARMLRHRRPQNGLDAKFSLEFAMAAAAIKGRVGRRELMDDVVRDPAIQAFFDKVRCRTLSDTDPEEPVHSPYDRVTVTLASGRLLDSGPVAHAEGHFRRPATLERLRLKFVDCATPMLSPQAADDLFDVLRNLPIIGHVGRLRISPLLSERLAE